MTDDDKYVTWRTFRSGIVAVAESAWDPTDDLLVRAWKSGHWEPQNPTSEDLHAA